MNGQWKVALAGALGGAAIALVVVFGAAALGAFPGAGDKAMHAYLESHPEILADMTSTLQAKQQEDDDSTRQVAVNKLGLKAFFDPRLAFITGPKTAKTTLVEFFDYNCPYCRASIPAVKKYYAAHKNDTRFAFIEFPIKGPQSTVAARAAIAARNQPDKYLAFHFALMSEDDVTDDNMIYADAAKAGLDVNRLKADMQKPEVDEAIARAKTLADAAKIDGTPAFIIDGKMREGALDTDILNKMVKG
ncbi:MAG TPA: thioredoxin domain-containing protein [Rhizomicrobium sp.]|jgi:protein-disulfide isomerase